jgi:hypothetical protein
VLAAVRRRQRSAGNLDLVAALPICQARRFGVRREQCALNWWAARVSIPAPWDIASQTLTPPDAGALTAAGKRRRKARREHAVTRLAVRALADALRGRLNIGPSSPK